MGNVIFGNSLVADGVAGSAFGARTAVTVGINTSVVLPVGWYYVENDAHTIVRKVYDASTGVYTIVGASAIGPVWSDGLSVEWRGDGTGGTGHYTQILGAEG